MNFCFVIFTQDQFIGTKEVSYSYSTDNFINSYLVLWNLPSRSLIKPFPSNHQSHFYWLAGAARGLSHSSIVAWGLFLESPETFRAHFGWHNSLCIFKTKATLQLFLFLFPLQHMKRPASQNMQSFTNGFSGPKSFRDFRETGPWSRILGTLSYVR